LAVGPGEQAGGIRSHQPREDLMAKKPAKKKKMTKKTTTKKKK
jgi:hypothetical protein